MERERIEATPRKAMTKARRLRLYLMCRGRCGIPDCNAPVPMEGTVIDHRVPLWMGGSDTDDNLRFLCRACDRLKTSGDQTSIAKVKRLIRKADPETRKPSRMRSRSQWPKGRKLQSRGWK